MNHDERDPQLEAEYRRASEADAGRPAAATRVAILAEAAAGAAARRRATPAANQSRYWMRAVAGVAVVGVAIMLWRQTDHRLPGEATVMVVESQLQQDSATSATALEPAAVEEAPPAPQAPAAPASRRAAESSAEPARELRAEPQATAPPAVVEESQQKAAAPPAPEQSADASAAGGAQAPAAFASAAATEADSLLRRHFPAQYQSQSAHRLWLTRNAAGEVLQSGELMAGQSLADLAPQIQDWRTTSVTNANGQPIELSIGEIP